MQKIFPFLWFDNQAEEAARFYTSVFQNSAISEVSRYKEGTPGEPGAVMSVSFTLAGQEFAALNGGPVFHFTPATSFFVSCETREEVDRLWQALSEGGMALMELDEYPFSPRFGWLNDRYGVSWQISLAGKPLSITPFLMFVGDQTGRAEEAINTYTRLFPNSHIEQIERFGPGMGEPEGAVMLARFKLAGQEFLANDGGTAHQFTFTEAISFLVRCESQAEVDFFWDNLGSGGEIQQCGWLRDKFGVTWQIVPNALFDLMNDSDPEKAVRVTQAMLKMTKIDIGQLQAAYDQG